MLGFLFFKFPSFLFSFVLLTENTSDSSSTTPHFPPPVCVCSPPLSLGSPFYFLLLAHGNLFSLDHQVFIYVNNCRAAPRGRRAEVIATHNLTHNLLTPTPRTPPTPTPLPGLTASRGKQCQLPPGSCAAARPVAATGYSTRQLCGIAAGSEGDFGSQLSCSPGLAELALDPRSRAVSLTVSTGWEGPLQALTTD